MHHIRVQPIPGGKIEDMQLIMSKRNIEGSLPKMPRYHKQITRKNR